MTASSLRDNAVPLYFSPAQLTDFARFFADEVAEGKFPYVDYDRNERWHQRLYRDRRVDVWLISWLPTQGTQLHDHGGSSGAFTVLSGSLDEAAVSVARGSADPGAPGAVERARLVDRRRHTGEAVSFGPHYVHDVRNLSSTAAVSVHAYSPPLTTMNFYDLVYQEGVQSLQPLATVATDDPETAAPARGVPLAS
ncbi:cysteine dioxygenase family protein [Jatrophihabitans endophyticus]|uniref:cysteine dioxygenase n=1 Tax=Jatrophihabitans endophyticus TaxID=1206085 RepID=UPI001A032D46|nr:cysteine dioxygenase family protein [Jatrophihabitans endophyticus]MBE7187354.1 cysteine dioxygenase family protein [Jatrophihabitans endophyticus]